MPTIIPTLPFIAHRRTVRRTPPPVAPLVLVSASFDAGDLTVTLGFDRAIDLADADLAQIAVQDLPVSGARWVGDAVVSQPTVASVVIGVVESGSATSPTTVLDASAANGIVAVDDSGTWAGVTGLALPWP